MILEVQTMNKKLEFGHLLEYLLGIRGWKASRLARELNVDPSYVRKWVRGDRVPSLKSNYVSNMSDCFLELEQKDEFKKYIEKLGYKDEISIFQLLKEAQINSLDLKSSIRYNITNNINSSKMFIYGKENIFNKMSEILDSVAMQNGIYKNIIMTFQGDKDIFDGYENARSVLVQYVYNMINYGWKLTHLWRINNNIHKKNTLINNIFTLLKAGNSYNPRYFRKYGTIIPPMEFIIIENVAAFQFIATSSIDYLDSMFIYRDEEEINAIKQYLNLMEKETNPLIETTDLENLSLDSNEILIYNEGDSFIANNKKYINLLKINKIKEIIVLDNIQDNSEYIRDIIYMMENHEWYEAAVITKNNQYRNLPDFLMINKNKDAMFTINEETYKIDECVIVAGLETYFSEIWNEILDQYKDIDFLKSLI